MFKAGQVTLDGSQKIREGSYSIVRMGRLMVEGERHAQPVEIKAIKFLSSGALEDRKEQRRASIHFLAVMFGLTARFSDYTSR